MKIEQRAQAIVNGLLASKDRLTPDDYNFVARQIREAVQAAYEDAAQQIETMPVFARPRDCAGIIRNRAKEVLQ